MTNINKISKELKTPKKYLSFQKSI